MDNEKIIQFYDSTVAEAVKSGVNDRIIGLFRKLLREGLNGNSNVLELGSGVGVMTFLLSKYVRKGQIHAVDISPQRVEFARQRNRRRNISFFVHDIVQFTPTLRNFDFITLFDVMEHIPIDRHDALFRNLAESCNENTKILINIPNPAYMEYERKRDSKELQIIDQPIPLGLTLQNLEKNGFTLQSLETSSVWVENDYQFLVAMKKGAFQEKYVSERRNPAQKLLNKLERVYRRLRYKF